MQDSIGLFQGLELTIDEKVDLLFEYLHTAYWFNDIDDIAPYIQH